MRLPPPMGRYLVASAMEGTDCARYGPYFEQRKWSIGCEKREKPVWCTAKDGKERERERVGWFRVQIVCECESRVEEGHFPFLSGHNRNDDNERI